MATFYISPNGNDDANGLTADTAFQSFQVAADAMAGTEGEDTTLVTRGIYVLEDTVVLEGPEYNGSSFREAEEGGAIITAVREEFSMFELTDVAGVTFEGLTFRGISTLAEDAIDVPAAIHANRSALINITDNGFQNLPAGVWLDDESQNIIVNGNRFFNIGGAAVDITAGSFGNAVTNNTMIHTGFYWDNQTASITMGDSFGNLIAHNEIADTAHFGIGEWNSLPGNKSGGNTIEYNVLRATGQLVEDTGGIYIFSSDDQLHEGTTIRYNSITDTGVDLSWGIYLDDLTNNAQVYSNYITGSGIAGMMIHGGDNNAFYNNISVDSDQFGFEYLEIDGRSMAGNQVYQNMIATPNDVGSQLISLEKDLVDPANINNNVYQSLNPEPPTGDGTWEEWIEYGGDEGSIVIPSAGEVNEDGQFILNAAALAQGMEQLPWDQMGHQDGFDFDFDFGIDGGEVGPEALSVMLSGTGYQDQINPAFIIYLDGQELASGSVDVDHNDGGKYSETFSYIVDVGPGPHMLEIEFVNQFAAPAGTMSLDIQEVTWGGVAQGPDPDVTLTTNGFYAMPLAGGMP